MSETIIAVIITGIFSVIGSYIANKTISEKTNKENEIKAALREQRQQDRLEAIEHKLDIHNGYAEKLGSIDISMAAMQKDIEYLKEGGRK